MDDSHPELEQFRNQWREEVSARTKGTATVSEKKQSRPPVPTRASFKHANAPPLPPTAANIPATHNGEDVDGLDPKTYHDLEDTDSRRRLDSNQHPSSSVDANRTLDSALDHYERAVEKESQGSLGDSLSLYRKAYRLDSRVDQTYKNKHFPPSSFASRSSNPNPSNAAVTVPNPAHHSLQGSATSLSDLIPTFSNLSIPAEPAPTDNSPAPPCPIRTIPSEVLVEILNYTAIADVASFVRLAQVCKRLAYLVATEDRIWKRVCCGDEVGFGAMHYDWRCDIYGAALPSDNDTSDGYTLESRPSTTRTLAPSSTPLSTDPSTLALLHKTYASSWLRMFRTRPRIRFNGCYISTVNYVRPGASSPTQISWNTPVHIVTYYRYLRFFRDGTAISLLTTAEPADVVHHLTKENTHSHHTGAFPAVAVMNSALRGRWRLSGRGAGTRARARTSLPSDSNDNNNNNDIGNANANESVSPDAAADKHPVPEPEPEPEPESEGDLHVETEGVDAKYMYKMQLSLRSAGRAARNNKLTWRGFWSYNKLTDDWAPFALKNDRAFFWSRVRSYGVG